MFRPSGLALISSTVAPSRSATIGATSNIAPLAQSSTMSSPCRQPAGNSDTSHPTYSSANRASASVSLRRPGFGRSGCEQRVEPGLDRRLRGVVQLQPAGGEQLHPVVLERVVRRGDHRRRQTMDHTGTGQRRRRQHPGRPHGRPCTGQAVREGALEVGAALSRVPPDDPRRRAEHLRRGAAEPRDERGGELGVRSTAHTIGAEAHGDARRRISAWCTAAPCAPSSGRTSCSPSCAGRASGGRPSSAWPAARDRARRGRGRSPCAAHRPGR